jgi:hypothetical protein
MAAPWLAEPCWDRPCGTGSASRVAGLASFHAGFLVGIPLLRSEGNLRSGLRLVSSNTCGCSTGRRHGREGTATLSAAAGIIRQGHAGLHLHHRQSRHGGGCRRRAGFGRHQCALQC